jgi:hypothetical protein
MRTYFAQVETRYRAIKNCPFTLDILLRFLAVICVLRMADRNSHIEPNFLDYSEIDLNEYLQKNGYLER